MDLFEKHQLNTIYTIKINAANMNQQHIINICRLKNINIKNHTIKINNFNVKILHNSIQVCVKNHNDINIIINELKQLFDINSQMEILLVTVQLEKPCMDLYFKSLNGIEIIQTPAGYHIKNKSTMLVYSKNIIISGKLEDVKNMYLHLYATTTLPIVLKTLSKLDSYFSYLPSELINVVLEFMY
jgi:hypothetical protein